jgi:hypothetical protein
MLTKKRVKTSLLFDVIVVFVSFFVVIHSIYKCWETDKTTIALTKTIINNEADLAVIDINNRLLYLMKTGQDLADALTNGTIAYNEVENRAKQIMVANHSGDTPSKFYNFSVSFDKGIYDSSKPEQLANWIYIADKKTGQIKLLKRDYDYTVKDNSVKTIWFTKAVEERKPFWQQPKYGDVSNNFLVAYTIPFFTSPSKEKVAGVIAVGFSTDELKNIMYRQDYRKTGFGMILSDEGHLIYHPNHIMPLVDVSHYHKYAQDAFNFIKQLKKDGDNNQSIQAYELPSSHEKAWVIFKTIPASNWRYQIVFLESELGIEQKTLATKIYLIVATIIFIIAFSSIFFIRRYRKIEDLWYFSSIIGITFLVGTAFLWKNADLKALELSPDIHKIASEPDVEAYKKQQNEFLDALHKKPPFYIPTGVFIKAAEFEGSNNITVAGYVWQKYQLDNQASSNVIPANFCTLASTIMPKEKSILLFGAFEEDEKTRLDCEQSSYRIINNRTVTLGWYFKVQLRQPFNYSNFPLDKNLIWLRLRPNSDSDDIVFTPDFTSYPYIYEKFLMGIDLKDFILPSWEVFSTFFSIQTADLNSNFGIIGYVGQVSQELSFNIAIKRVFLDSMFSTVVPICIIYLILFVILFGTLSNLLEVLAINAGLLFSVALWHSSLRTSLSSTGVTYFETFYFVCYFVISLVCINSVLLACQYELALLHYRNNLLPKLAFLPLVSGITFVITLLMLF